MSDVKDGDTIAFTMPGGEKLTLMADSRVPPGTLVPHKYAHDQSHILPVEHAHDKERANLAYALSRLIVKFAGHVDEMSPSGVGGLAVVLPAPLFDAMATEPRAGLPEIRLVVPGGIVTIRHAEGA